MSDERWRDAFGPESPEELEALVPEEVVGAVWPRLASELAARPRSRPPARWLVPALAAALAVFMLTSGWLLRENRLLQRRAAVEWSAPITTATPHLPAPSRTVTAGELAARLSRLPADTPVLDAAGAERMLREGRPLWHALLRGPDLDAVIADGVTAREAVLVLRRLDAQTPIRLGGALSAPTPTRS
jgi:hypothetical protein